MVRRACVILLLVLVVAFPITAAAADLPIDINRIGQQGNTGQHRHGHTHFGAGLFTQESRRVNEAMAAHLLRRQEASLDSLFNTMPVERIFDPYEHIANVANGFALFSVPTDFSHIYIPAQAEAIPTWVFVLTISLCMATGFVLAVVMIQKKRGDEADVY